MSYYETTTTMLLVTWSRYEDQASLGMVLWCSSLTSYSLAYWVQPLLLVDRSYSEPCLTLMWKYLTWHVSQVQCKHLHLCQVGSIWSCTSGQKVIKSHVFRIVAGCLWCICILWAMLLYRESLYSSITKTTSLYAPGAHKHVVFVTRAWCQNAVTKLLHYVRYKVWPVVNFTTVFKNILYRQTTHCEPCIVRSILLACPVLALTCKW